MGYELSTCKLVSFIFICFTLFLKILKFLFLSFYNYFRMFNIWQILWIYVTLLYLRFLTLLHFLHCIISHFIEYFISIIFFNFQFFSFCIAPFLCLVPVSQIQNWVSKNVGSSGNPYTKSCVLGTLPKTSPMTSLSGIHILIPFSWVWANLMTCF